MVRKKPKRTAESDRPLVLGLTANQVVAFNLTQARAWKGWTQEEAAEALEPYLGVRWSKATFSQAERSVAGRVIRNFTADEIVAFARAFELPVTWFFMPPPPWPEPGLPARLESPDSEPWGQSIATLVDLVFGDPGQQALLSLRLDRFLDELGPDGLTAAQHRITSLVSTRIATVIRQGFRNLGTWQTNLRAIANQLQTLELVAKRAVAEDTGIDPRELRIPRDPEPAEDEPNREGG